MSVRRWTLKIKKIKKNKKEIKKLKKGASATEIQK
jgi:hypothetical protein